MNSIELNFEETDYFKSPRKTFPKAVQKMLVLFNVDMSWQLCLESNLLPPLEVINNYLSIGESDLSTAMVWGRELKFEVELPSGIVKWLPLWMRSNVLIGEFKSTLEPQGGTVKWEPFTVTEEDYKCFQQILAVSGIKLRIENFGNERGDYKEWFSLVFKRCKHGRSLKSSSAKPEE